MTGNNSARAKSRVRPFIPLAPNVENRRRSYATAAKAMAPGFESTTIATALVCVTGSLISAPPAIAEVVYTPTYQVLSRHQAGGTELELDVNNDGSPDFLIQLFRGSSYSSGHRRLYGGMDAAGVTDSNQVVESKNQRWESDLPLGSPIGPNAKFPTHGQSMAHCTDFFSEHKYFSSGPWRNVTNRYLGLKFQVSGETHYGWARVSVSQGCHYVLTLTGYAYETVADKPILAGIIPYINNPQADAVPETKTGSLGALAAGFQASKK